MNHFRGPRPHDSLSFGSLQGACPRYPVNGGQTRKMPTEPKPAKVSVPSSGDGTSQLSPAQLSSAGRVHTSVSSIAMDRGLLAVGSGVPPAHGEAWLAADG